MFFHHEYTQPNPLIVFCLLIHLGITQSMIFEWSDDTLQPILVSKSSSISIRLSYRKTQSEYLNTISQNFCDIFYSISGIFCVVWFDIVSLSGEKAYKMNVEYIDRYYIFRTGFNLFEILVFNDFDFNQEYQKLVQSEISQFFQLKLSNIFVGLLQIPKRYWVDISNFLDRFSHLFESMEELTLIFLPLPVSEIWSMLINCWKHI